jgi:hypothetical protein
MSSLTRYDSEGIEIFINGNGESFASVSGVARMSCRNESTVRDFINSRSVYTVEAQVPTSTGLKTARLLSEHSICEVLAEYNPTRLQQFAVLGIRTALHQLVGYQSQSSNPNEVGLEILVKLSAVIVDNTFAGVNLKAEILAGLKLNAAESLVPELIPHLKSARQLLINNTATEHQLLTATELGQRLGISAQAVNKRLVELGLQTKNPNKKSKKDTSYVASGQGLEFSDLTLATGMGKDSTTYQQLRWYDSVLSMV